MTKVMASAKGKTHSASDADPKQKNKRDLSHEKMMAKVREMITTIVENMDILVNGTGNETNVKDALATVASGDLQGMATEVTDLIRGGL